MSLRALVVDDNPAAREILVDALSGTAEQVDAVSGGAEAVAAVKQHDGRSPYDVVFMDWKMPGMDGLQATRLIKGDPGIREQPVVVMVTAFGREEVREEAERLNIEAFLVKPVTKSMLVDTLVTLFSPSGGETAAASGLAVEKGVRLEGLSVLLVEDNEINQQVAVELIEGVGGKVTVASDGREGVERLEAAPDPVPYDVVLMDIQMPEMDGYQATARLRAQARFAKLPIVAMTAHATIEERQRCVAAGMNDHVAKPIDPAALYAALRHYCATGPAEVPSRDESPGGSRPRGRCRGWRASTPRRAFGAWRATGSSTCGSCGSSWRATRTPRIGSGRASGGDQAVAERLAHTVKGTAGNLAAGPVQAAAGALEKAIRDGIEATRVESLRAQLGEALRSLSQALRPALADAADTPVDRGGRDRSAGGAGRAQGDGRPLVAPPRGVRRQDRRRSRAGRPRAPRAPRRCGASGPLRQARHRLRFRRRSRGVAPGRRREGALGVAPCPSIKELSECRVLIVDDAKANVDMLVEALRGDYKLSVALDGEAALRAIERNAPDLLLLDIVMPGLDGYEVCRRLRADPATQEIPIMFLSSLDDVQDKARGFELGANDYLTKPFEILEVKARVRSLLKAKAYADAIRAAQERDLDIAREIQMGLLPSDLASLGRGMGLDIHATIEPARHVGRRPLRGLARVRGSAGGRGRRRVREGHHRGLVHGGHGDAASHPGPPARGAGRDPRAAQRGARRPEPARDVRDHGLPRGARRACHLRQRGPRRLAARGLGGAAPAGIPLFRNGARPLPGPALRERHAGARELGTASSSTRTA